MILSQEETRALQFSACSRSRRDGEAPGLLPFDLVGAGTPWLVDVLLKTRRAAQLRIHSGAEHVLQEEIIHCPHEVHVELTLRLLFVLIPNDGFMSQASRTFRLPPPALVSLCERLGPSEASGPVLLPLRPSVQLSSCWRPRGYFSK